MEPGFNFTHSSNARANVPNLAWTWLAWALASTLEQAPKHRPCPQQPGPNTRNRTRNELMLVASTGFTRRIHNGEMLPCNMLSLSYQRNVRNTPQSLASALDCFMMPTTRLIINKFNTHQGMQQRMSVRPGIPTTQAALAFLLNWATISLPNVCARCHHSEPPRHKVLQQIGAGGALWFTHPPRGGLYLWIRPGYRYFIGKWLKRCIYGLLALAGCIKRLQ